jgi:uncharacterized protein YfdQ (DUF2303 family)
MSDENIKGNTQAALDAGKLLADLKRFGVNDSVIVAAVPEGHELQVQDLEQFQDRPRRVMKTLQAGDAESFVNYFNRFAVNTSVVFFTQRKSGGEFSGVVDYHTPTTPEWCGHQVNYTPVETEEWKTWRDGDKHVFNQAEFAEFLDNNLLDIIEPAAADLLEIAKTLEARKSVNFKSGVRLENGDHALTWEETTAAKAGVKGELDIPGAFTLMFPLYRGGNPAELTARLRYRIDGGHVVFWFELIRPHKVVEAQLETLKQVIVSGIGDHAFIAGE